MKVLRVGDPHVRPSNVEDSNLLMEFVKKTVLEAKIDRLEILGDLHHTHAVIRLEVLEFWSKWLKVLRDIVETVVLVGNHDMANPTNPSSNALTVFKDIRDDKLKIVDVPMQCGIYGYTPYFHSGIDFVKSAKELYQNGAKVLVCHQTFSGSQYDNGFYAPEGINPDDIPFDIIISGHIHKEQIIANGKVDYPGTPKWDTASDANENKGIWIYTHDDVNGKVISRELISTAEVVTPIVSVTWLEGQEKPEFPKNAKVSVELVGSSSWISKQKTSIKGLASIKTKITDKVNKLERKAGNSLENYLTNMYSTNMDRKRLLKYAKEIGIV